MLSRFSILLFLSAFTTGVIAQQKLSPSRTNEGFIFVENGRLYHPDGKEVALWGVNLQPMISWEYKSLMSRVGIGKDAATWKRMVDDALDELSIMNSRVLRVHLTPADFTDGNGELVQTIYLDLLDYTLAEAGKRGIYYYICFLNHMNNYEVYSSFMNFSSDDRERWIFDDNIVTKSQNYITKLLNRVNPYNNVAYKNDTSIVVWEIINEPSYYSYDQIKSTVYYAKYQTWLAENALVDNNGVNYPLYRSEVVQQYINRMYDTIRAAGAKQPIAWNCNWHRMINGREDVFQAIADSKVDVISFCNYPGQDEASKLGPYWQNPIDLSDFDFSGWYTNAYNNRDWYGWALEPRFAEKAKVVYEFETFFNQSAYLYPVMADFMRAMGVQVATMWHYSFSGYAPYRNGSHFLNLNCTPGKAASFVVASKIFENTPILLPYHINSTTEWTTDDFMYSYKKNLSIFSNEDEYISSGSLYSPETQMPHQAVKHILGYGSSPVVKYCGSGIYDIHISENEIEVHLNPNSGWLRPPWENDGMKILVTKLGYDRNYLLEIRLEGWNSKGSVLYRVEEGARLPQEFIGSGLKFIAKPGNYLVQKK